MACSRFPRDCRKWNADAGAEIPERFVKPRHAIARFSYGVESCNRCFRVGGSVS